MEFSYSVNKIKYLNNKIMVQNSKQGYINVDFPENLVNHFFCCFIFFFINCFVLDKYS